MTTTSVFGRARQLLSLALVLALGALVLSVDQAKMQAVSPETDFSIDFQDLLLKPARR